MRIPSQFNDSSLYRPPRGERQGEANGTTRRVHPPSTGTARRLLRLSVGLLLVIVVMNEARQTDLYQPFFASGSEGWVEVETSASGHEISSDRPTHNEFDRDHEYAGAARWVSEMDIALQRSWTATLFDLQGDRNREGSPSAEDWKGVSVDQLRQSSQLLNELSNPETSQEIDRIIADLDRMMEFAETGSISGDDATAHDWDEIRWWAKPLIEALDAAALTRVDDGTFWTGRDSDAFYLQLARSSELPADHAPVTGTLPLLQQPDVYRGKRIRIVGSLGLAERHDAQANRLGIGEYWKLWIVPDDGGVRPTVLITQSLPPAIQRSLTPDGKWDRRSNADNPDGHLAAVGRFIKRLPYRSSVGADLAPVVIGRVVATRGVTTEADESKPSSNDGGEANSDASPRRAVGYVLAVLAGIAVALGLMYRTSVDAKRTRALRRLSNEASGVDLSGLADPSLERNNPQEKPGDES